MGIALDGFDGHDAENGTFGRALCFVKPGVNGVESLVDEVERARAENKAVKDRLARLEALMAELTARLPPNKPSAR